MEKIVCLVLALAIGLNGCSLKKEDEYQDRIVNGIINKDADEIMECFCDELKTDETMKEVKNKGGQTLCRNCEQVS